MPVTILFKKDLPEAERTTIIQTLIQGCEEIYLPKIKEALMNEAHFHSEGLAEFITKLDALIDALKYRQVRRMNANKSLIDLPFFKEEIVAFKDQLGWGQFSLLFNVDDGIVRDISIVDYYIS